MYNNYRIYSISGLGAYYFNFKHFSLNLIMVRTFVGDRFRSRRFTVYDSLSENSRKRDTGLEFFEF